MLNFTDNWWLHSSSGLYVDFTIGFFIFVPLLKKIKVTQVNKRSTHYLINQRLTHKNPPHGQVPLPCYHSQEITQNITRESG